MAKGQNTVKAKILDFVESRGTARFTDIQRFLVDMKYGEGTYDDGFQMEDTYIWRKDGKGYDIKPRKRNIYRGYFSSAFSSGWGKEEYLFNDAGYGKLEKLENGHYKTVR